MIFLHALTADSAYPTSRDISATKTVASNRGVIGWCMNPNVLRTPIKHELAFWA